MSFSDTIQALLDSKGATQVQFVTPEQKVYEALEKMAEFGIGAVLVLDSERLVGILSERDYARRGILMGHASRDTYVHQIMTSPVFYVSPQNTVDECMALMTEHHFRHLPVVKDDVVLGVISIGDLVKWVIAGQQAAIKELESYITGVYPA